MEAILWVHAGMAMILVILGFLALTARKSMASRHPRVGEVYFWLLAATLSLGLVVGARNPAISLFEIMTPPTFLMGLLGYVMVKRKPRNWLRWHIAGQGGSYIGVLTATGFQVFPRFLPDSPLLTIAYWLAPTAIGSYLIARTIAKWTRPPLRRQPATSA